MNRDVLLRRAWDVTQHDATFQVLGGGMRMFWIRVVLEIHQAGDGFALGFGRPGDRFRSRAELVGSLNRSEADLGELVHRGLLVDAKGGAIGIPGGLGLTPRHRPARPVRRQFKPAIIQGGLP